MKRRFGKRLDRQPSEDLTMEEKKTDKVKVKLLLRKARVTFEKLCGFACDDLRSFEGLTVAMYRPTDPACLGVCRALFGKTYIFFFFFARDLYIRCYNK